MPLSLDSGVASVQQPLLASGARNSSKSWDLSRGYSNNRLVSSTFRRSKKFRGCCLLFLCFLLGLRLYVSSLGGRYATVLLPTLISRKESISRMTEASSSLWSNFFLSLDCLGLYWGRVKIISSSAFVTILQWWPLWPPPTRKLILAGGSKAFIFIDVALMVSRPHSPSSLISLKRLLRLWGCYPCCMLAE